MSGKTEAPEIKELRELCELSLFEFAQWIFPDRYYGDVHRELFAFFQAEGGSPYRLALIPRDHQKSHCIAVYAGWRLTRDPDWTFSYVSSNPTLAEDQLGVIKHILTCDRHRLLWPDHLNYVRGRTGELEHKKTGTWTRTEISLDHPLRKERAIRDPSVRATSAKSTNTGNHVKEVIFDDLVTDENYQSAAEMADVIRCYKSFAKIATTDSLMKAVGTRYGTDDLYALLTALSYTDSRGEEDVEVKLWDVFEKVVEDSPRRTGDGNYLWPRMQQPDGRWYGFDSTELSKKKASMEVDHDVTSFYAQYYNDPNDASTNRLCRDDFVRYDLKHLHCEGDVWHYRNKPLKVYAAGDLAFTDGGAVSARFRDWTAFVVIGLDCDGYIYVLDIDRFQTDKPEIYYERIMDLHNKWKFREVTIESNNAGAFVKRDLEAMIRRNGEFLTVNGKAHVSHEGKKVERIEQTLRPRYKNKTILHPEIGLIRILEEELVLARPPHDDIKDALALAISEARAPGKRGSWSKGKKGNVLKLNRFGGARTTRRSS